jgi:outer membrane biosynthesis protein TonB
MEYREENNYPKAFLATGVVLAALMLLCWFIVFQTPPKPIEGTGGILVNYGTTDAGMGEDFTSREQPSVSPKANHVAPNKVTPAPPTEQKTATDNSDKKILTQSNEDAPEVASNSKKPSTNIATEAKKVVAKPVVNQNALYKGAKPSTGSGGDGTTNTPGNQGNPNGSTLTNNYKGTGSGDGGTGIANRSWVSRPQKPSVTNQSGVVYIDYVVDKRGNVVQVGIGRGTTIVDNALIDKCLSAVRNCKLSASDNAPTNQQGRIEWIFTPK